MFAPFGLTPAFASAGGPAAPRLGGPPGPRPGWLSPRGGASASLVSGTGRPPALGSRPAGGPALPGSAPRGPERPSRPTPPEPPDRPTPPPPPAPGPARRGPASGALRGRLAVAAVAAGALATAGHSLAGLESLAPTGDAATAELSLASRGTPDTGDASSASGSGTGGSVLDAATAGVLPTTAATAGTTTPTTPTTTTPTAGADGTSVPSGTAAGQVTSLTKAAQRAAEITAARDAAARPQFVKPAEGRFTSGFGARWGSSHRGIDIANAIGTPIVSVGDGEVIESGPASGFGMWVRVQLDDGTINVYGHVNRSYVREGQRVRAGEEIAEIGNRGQSTGPHLHFEVWTEGGRKINPLPWLAERGVSLGSQQD